MNRRQFLATTGAVVTAAVAGCSDDDEPEDGDPKKSPSAVAEAYVRLSPADPKPEEMEELLHSESPIDPQERAARPERGLGAVGGVNWEVTDRREDLEEDTLEATAQSRGGFDLDQETIETVATQENKLLTLAVDFEFESEDIPESRAQQIDKLLQFDLQLLVAEEDGEWRVVDDSVDLFSKLEQRLEPYGFQFDEES